jgi:hypothetical protein
MGKYISKHNYVIALISTHLFNITDIVKTKQLGVEMGHFKS